MPRTRAALRTAAIGATGTMAVTLFGAATPASAATPMPKTGCSVTAWPPTGGSTIFGNGNIACDSWYTGNMTISNQLRKYANGQWVDAGQPVTKSFWGGTAVGDGTWVPCDFSGQTQFKTVTTGTADGVTATDTSPAVTYSCS
ncbi:conserved exported hypothetical protein [Frankia canadensis]|uniref:Secreted protein n=1 Tax=Frankia canadensis TaxID=1836972 RepID=A0A2I2KY96_9ACTN|nr:hypothetical protein [Frankia canadensis]SNQ50635.1 conserved exported hypothetical protein [Frankia canadensis]SOU57925.1 conserved exported hypothetical protein [Frankia canadensis]